jgi:predicted PurR-regulated permease PerM
VSAPTDTAYARWRTTGFILWSIVGAALIAWGLALIVGRLWPAFVPFILAFVIVFMLRGPVSSFERRGVNRSLAVLIWFGIGAVVVAIVVLFIGPIVAEQVAELSRQVPSYLDRGQESLTAAEQRFTTLVIPDWLRVTTETFSGQLGRLVSRVGEPAARAVVSAGGGVVTFLLDVFLALVISFWILKDLPKIRREIRLIAGPRYSEDVDNLFYTVARMVGGYLKGQTIASLATGALVTAALAVAGVPYALVLGLITFVFNYIPYVGPFVAGLLAATVAFFDAGLGLGLIAIAIVVGSQILVDQLLTPRVMSEQVSLHPTLVIFSLLVGGTLFGFFGLLLAIPVAATIQALFVYYWERRTKVSLASDNGALFRGHEPAVLSHPAETAEDAQTPHEEPRSVPTERADKPGGTAK